MVKKGTGTQTAPPWIRSCAFDLTWILGPAFWSVALVLLLPHERLLNPEMPLWVWVSLVIGIDVAHVYSTLYRTYFDPTERQRYRTHLLAIPLLCWVAGVILYSFGANVFWTVLAYLAVFHFVRQQYGFLRMYSRYESVPAWARSIDTALLYMTMLYPLAAWHAALPRNYTWFIEGDFLKGAGGSLVAVALALYALTTILFLAKEAYLCRPACRVNIPKYLLILGTALAWYIGIVHFNADIPFTITNVISHGIPYMALVWAFGQKRPTPQPYALTALFSPLALPIFIGLLWMLSYLEEAAWHTLIWREHLSLFTWALPLFEPVTSTALLGILVPLLAVPQATHYVLDAFVWKVRRPDPGLAQLLGLDKGVKP